MAKRPGSKGSRSERKAGRQRASRAREHGLPLRQEPESRIVRTTPGPRSAQGEDRSSDAAEARAKPSQGIPNIVKVVGVALALLAAAYTLSRFRDDSAPETRAAPEPPSAASTPGVASLAPSVAAAERALEPAPVAEPLLPVAVESSTPSVAAPAVSVPAKPPAPKPVVVAPRPVAVPAVPAAPAPAAAEPVPRAPKPGSASPAQPVDNPY